jgi:hypothetical protein
MIPDGIYSAVFQGVDDYQIPCQKITRRKPKWYWRFRISYGPYAGQIAGKASSTKPTEDNACGNMMEMLTIAVDGSPAPYNEFHPILYEREKVRVFISKGIVHTVMPPTVIPVSCLIPKTSPAFV